MKLKHLIYIGATLPMLGLGSCMEFDTPADEFNANETEVKPEVFHGDADNLEIKDVDEETFAAAKTELDQYLQQFITAQYYMLGGKNGAMPAEHQYQYVYSLTTDNYAGYTTCTQSWNGQFPTTYSYYSGYCEGPYGAFLSIKTHLANFLNHDQANNMVEMKAIALLMFDYRAQEMVDIYGSIPYTDHKANKETNPFEFQKGQDIYYTIIQNLDDIIKVFDNFKNRPTWYQDEINSMLTRYDAVTQTKSIDTWKKFANSLKLRMAMHLVKVNPTDAQKYAEEAIASGVVEDQLNEVGLNPKTGCYNAHPLKVIFSGWNDVRVNASFVSLLASLNHPYYHYMIAPTTDDLVNTATGDVYPAGSGIVGLRAGLVMENSQQYFSNMRVAYSQLTGEDFEYMPLYLIKWAEVDFLRAEGALRGWNMGGTAQEFYERGIKNGDCSDRFEYKTGHYEEYLDEYMALEQPLEYKYVDYMDHANDHESVTKIGVKWNEADDNETKLEKIITQKYIAIFPYSYEAWTDMRRTGYPKIFPVLNVSYGDGSLKDGDLIRRQLLPTSSLQAGIEDVQNTGLAAIGGKDEQATRVFWDVEGQGNF